MIEKLTDADTEWIIDSLYMIREESPFYRDRPADEAHTRTCFGAMLDNPNFIGIKYNDMGFILGGASDAWYSPEFNAYEELLFVHPAFRGGRVASRLILGFVDKAKELGCAKVIAGATTDINDHGVLSLYNRLGFHKMGHLMVRKLI